MYKKSLTKGGELYLIINRIRVANKLTSRMFEFDLKNYEF